MLPYQREHAAQHLPELDARAEPPAALVEEAAHLRGEWDKGGVRSGSGSGEGRGGRGLGRLVGSLNADRAGVPLWGKEGGRVWGGAGGSRWGLRVAVEVIVPAGRGA